MPYSPQPPASIQSVEELRQWLQDELRNVALAINETQIVDLRPSYRAPERLRDGVIVYADGTQFNPGSGEGPYVWDGTAWKYMIAPAATDLSALTAAVAANAAAITALQATSPPGLIFLLSQTASNTSSIAFTGLDNTTYDHYVFHFSLRPSVTDVGLDIRMSTNNGASYDSGSVYWWSWVYSTLNASGAFQTGVFPGNLIQISGGRNTSRSNGTIRFWPSNGTDQNFIEGSTAYINSAALVHAHVAGIHASTTTAVNAIQFFATSGNLTSGTIKLYGVRKS